VTTAGFQRARSAEQRQQRRDTILGVARTMLDRHPLAGVSLRELSREVGLSKSNVVRYFPTREAVFLAVLVEDWSAWLDDVEQRLAGASRRRSVHARHAELAGVLTESLTDHPRLCDLVVVCQSVLEANVPVETARWFKTSALERITRLAEIVARRLSGPTEEQCFEVAGLLWALTVGAWPMAHPVPAVATVLAEPALAPLRVEFAPAVAHALTMVLDGMTASSARPA
jgi:AcrR family transcriptional regulator